MAIRAGGLAVREPTDVGSTFPDRRANGSRGNDQADVTPGLEPTKDGVKQFFALYIAAFPVLRMQPEDVIASGDKVVARLRCTGTPEGAPA